MEQNSEIGRILGLLGLDVKPAETAGQSHTPKSEAGAFRIVETETGAWIELEGEHEVLRMARPKCRMVLHLLPVVRAWASGESPSGTERDVRWLPVVRRRMQVLEIKAATWKPLWLSREQAVNLVVRADELRTFVGSSRSEA